MTLPHFSLFPRRRYGLRARVVLWYGLLALGLSILLAAVVWILVSRFVITEHESTALTETSVNAAAIQRGLNASEEDISQLLVTLPSTYREIALLRHGGQWYSSSPTVRSNDLPPDLLTRLEAGDPVRERVALSDHELLAVGLPLSQPGDAYLELFPLTDLDRIDRVLALALVGGVVATTALGLAAGWAASRYALRPLTEVTSAAAAFAGGDLSARLSAEDDADLRELARSFNHTADLLAERIAADVRFAADVSHELRTPLTTMLNSMQLLQARRADLPSSLAEPLDLLSDELDRFRRLVVDLLEISRDADCDHSEQESVTIGDLVRHAADAAAGRTVTHVDAAAEDRIVRADKRRLERMIANLVENAETHGRGCIAVNVNATNGGIRIEVDDAGPGVPEHLKQRIFERFARDGATTGRGVGLGLAIAARHARWHGGAIRVEDRPGGGASFVVELPTTLR